MLKLETILVLGAGASNPYGYPTGPGLVQKIIKELKSGPSAPFFDDRGIDKYQRMQFARDLQAADPPSIDSFLASRQEFSKAGKIAIALVLGPCEVHDPKGCPEIQKRKSPADDWYQYLWHALYDPPESIRNKKLRIITFNYDRSLPNYLHQAMCASFGYTDEEGGRLFNETLDLAHMYGSLDPLPWQGEGGRPYGTAITESDYLDRAVGRIRVIGEERKSDDVSWILEGLPDHNNVIFLGFAYHPQNMALLGITRKRSVLHRGSAYGFGRDDCVKLEKRFPLDLDKGSDALRDAKSLTFLRNWASLL